jgi:hypothetical protein
VINATLPLNCDMDFCRSSTDVGSFYDHFKEKLHKHDDPSGGF